MKYDEHEPAGVSTLKDNPLPPEYERKLKALDKEAQRDVHEFIDYKHSKRRKK